MREILTVQSGKWLFKPLTEKSLKRLNKVDLLDLIRQCGLSNWELVNIILDEQDRGRI